MTTTITHTHTHIGIYIIQVTRKKIGLMSTTLHGSRYR